MKNIWGIFIFIAFIICIVSYITNTPVGQKGTSSHFHDAVLMGNLEEVKLALKTNPKLVNDAPKGNATPLHKAAYKGNIVIAAFLIEKGADVNAKANCGLMRLREGIDRTPLHEASYKEHKGVVKLLIEKGGEINAKDKSERTPLHEAAYGGYKEIIQILLKNGANVNARDNNGGTPLHHAANKPLLNKAEKLKQKKVIELLIRNEAEINAKDDSGRTALDIADKINQKEIIDIHRSNAGKKNSDS